MLSRVMDAIPPQYGDFQAILCCISNVNGGYGRGFPLGEIRDFLNSPFFETKKRRNFAEIEKNVISRVCSNPLNYRTLHRRNRLLGSLIEEKMEKLRFFSCINRVIVVFCTVIDCKSFVCAI